MKKPLTALLLCSMLLLAVSCSGSSDNNDAESPDGSVEPMEGEGAGPDGLFNDALSESDKNTILTAIRDRTAADGAVYEFNAMEPVFTEGDDTIEVTFRYLDPNTRGGAPIAVISREDGDISSIRYTR